MTQGESDALFLKSHGTHQFINCNCNGDGEVEVRLSNCPNASCNEHCTKGSFLNGPLSVCLVEKMQVIPEEESQLRSDPCAVEIPCWCDIVSRQMAREGLCLIDCVEKGRTFL